MAYERFEVDRYTIALRRDSGPDVYRPAILSCGAFAPGQIKNMIIWFWEDYDAAPPNESILEPDRIIGKVHLPIEYYARYVDLVRNEKPVWAYVYDNPIMNSLTVGGEPVGEEET